MNINCVSQNRFWNNNMYWICSCEGCIYIWYFVRCTKQTRKQRGKFLRNLMRIFVKIDIECILWWKYVVTSSGWRTSVVVEPCDQDAISFLRITIADVRTSSDRVAKFSLELFIVLESVCNGLCWMANKFDWFSGYHTSY